MSATAQPSQARSSDSPPSSALFRAEALAAQSSQLLGGIRLAQPLAYSVWAAGALVVLASIGSVMAFGDVTKRATLTGVLTPEGGMPRLVSPVNGTVLEVKAREGEQVAADAPLFVISTERQSASGATSGAVALRMSERHLLAEQDVRRADERFDTRKRAVTDRLAALERDSAALERERALATSRVQLAQKQAERIDALASSGFVSDSQQQTKQDELLAARQQAEALERNQAALAKEKLALQLQLREAEQQLGSDRAEVSKALAYLAQEQAENESRRTTVIRAPRAGTVTGLTVQVGQAVQAGAPLAQLMPGEGTQTPGEGTQAKPNAPQAASQAPLQAHFYAPTRSAGFVEPGQAVRLRYAAFAYQKFGQHQGTVIAVDRTPYTPGELPSQALAALQTSAGASPEAVYRVTVQIEHQHIMAYGKPQPLKPGMVVEADVIQRTSKLWEWVTEPLRGFAQRGV
jgi:membrane fusion protein